ncbi:MAG: sulfopyruvate decarboxylase subunit alpha [Parcubacteria group bacterium Gr01-1014_38]|nr:MAG: sulfopyruvate decarboxylase subunit alpha [Parcubacteria group bacterium Gr01-1014_38]
MNAGDKTVFNIFAGERSEKADRMHQLFLELGVDFASGVPCGVLRHIIKNFDDDSKVLHVPANRESEAIGLAAGAYFGGKTPVVYMQNSGLFSASNDVASLVVPYKIPILFVVSFRGCEGEDAVQHLTTGRATEALLQSFGVPFVVFGEQNLETLIRSMFETMRTAELPTFLLLKRGWHR